MVTRVTFGNTGGAGGKPYITRGNTALTGAVNNTGDWTLIQVGGENNIFPVTKLVVSGNATSPATLGGNPADRILYVEVRIVPRGADIGSSGAVTTRHPIIKWLETETSLVKSTTSPVPIELNTDDLVDGNVFIRAASDGAGINFTALDLNVAVYGQFDLDLSETSAFTTTNNYYSTSITGTANTVNELPISGPGYFQGEFTQFGQFGDVKTSNQIGLSPVADLGNISPTYAWRYTSGDGSGNTPEATAIHNGGVLVSGIVCEEGDVLRVNRDAGGIVTYLKNGVVEATGGTTDTSAMRGDFILAFASARALGLRMDIGAGEVSPTFENESNVQAF